MKFMRERNRVEVDAYSLMIDALKDIWDKDRSRTKEKAIEMLSYIHLSSQIDPEAPFFASAKHEVKQLAMRNIWRDKPPKGIEKYDDAIEEYKKAYESPEVRIISTFNNKIDEIKILLDDTKPKLTENYNDKTGVTTYASNIGIITKAMKEIDELMDEKEKLEQRVRRQSAMSIQTLGSKKPNRRERRQMQNK